MDRNLWNIKSSRSAEFLKKTVKTNRNALWLKSLPFFSIILCEQAGKEQPWTKVDTYTEFAHYWLRDVIYHSLDKYQN